MANQNPTLLDDVLVTTVIGETIDALSGDDSVTDVVGGNNIFFGNTGSDTLNGGDGDDELYGQGLAFFTDDNASDTLNGGAGNDVLLGNGGSDILNGDEGDDEIWGDERFSFAILGFDSDVINGGDGNDTIYGGGGDDIIDGGNDNDTLTGGEGNDTINGGAGDDTIRGGGSFSPFDAGNDILNGGDGNDTIFGDNGDDVIDGGAGNDILRGGDGSDTIYGGEGNDNINDSSSNANLIHGGDGDDTVTITGGIGFATNTVYGDAGNDTIDASAASGNNLMDGGSGDDTIIGGAGDDTIIAGVGNNTLTGDSGADTFIISQDTGTQTTITDFETTVVGEKIDISQFSAFTSFGDLTITSASAIVDLGNGQTLTLLGLSPASLSGDDFIFHENVAPSDVTIDVSAVDRITDPSLIGKLSVVDADVADTHSFTVDDARFEVVNGVLKMVNANALDTEVSRSVKINVTATDPSFAQFTKAIQIATPALGGAFGTPDADIIIDPFADADRIFGNGGNDYLAGSEGADIISGGSGDDTIYAAGGDDIIYGENGADTIDGGDGEDTVTYWAADAGITVNLALGTASGSEAEGDVLVNVERVGATNFNDTLVGDAQNNLFLAGAGDDTLSGGAGDDTVFGSVGMDIIHGNDGNDELFGDSDNDTLNGNDGNDTISGGRGDDTIDGGAGDDTIYGESGADAIDGGAGIDLATYWGSSAGVTINLTTGTGVGGHAQGDTLTNIENIGASSHNDDLTGDANANIFLAGAGNDIIRGAGGDDYIYASNGDDIIIGQAGADQLFGSNGLDIFVFESTTDSTALDRDDIRDFVQGDDKLDVSALGFTLLSDVTVTQSGSNTFVADINSTFEFEISGLVTLVDSDFIWA